MKHIVISDLDGTISLDQGRSDFLRQEPKRWDEYYLACDQDTPNWPVIETLRALHAHKFQIIILTGRSDIAKAKTLAWLTRYRVPYDQLIMRAHGDHSADTDLKAKWADEHDLWNDVLFVLEDRERVVEMWRSRNIPCHQVAPGRF